MPCISDVMAMKWSGTQWQTIGFLVHKVLTRFRRYVWKPRAAGTWLAHKGHTKAWCFLWLPSELRKTCSMMFTYYVYNIFNIIFILWSNQYYIKDLRSYIYIFNIIFITIHNLFKTSRVRFSRRETNGRSSTSDFAATTSGSSCFSWFDGSECSIV